MFWFSLVLPILAAPACLAAPSQAKRQTSTGTVLYGYGKNVSGFPVFMDVASGSGALYISSANATSLEPITWDIPVMVDSTTQTANASFLDSTSAGALYLDASNDMFNQVLLVGSSASNSSFDGTMGITTYGKQLVYYNGSSVLSEFWAQQVETGIWALHWNSNNEYRSGGVPIVLKTIAPFPPKDAKN